ncbi:Uncharacterised protein [Serratia plymuthica]|uniref:Bacterial regulatory proteins, tetR family n=1 Tax=Serratia plymuthica TaxID=82996 RepID=A0A2X4URN1_SERPL|nr:Uncharacterised protein [Serratia plymuthica]
MGRQRSIDRDKVLDAAEEIVANQGAAGLTIDSVAKAMGSPKAECNTASAVKMR